MLRNKKQNRDYDTYEPQVLEEDSIEDVLESIGLKRTKKDRSRKLDEEDDDF